MIYYAVIDTNVLVSALLKKESLPDQIVQEVLTGKEIPLLNKEIIDEYRDVLMRPKFRFPRDIVMTLLTGITERAIIIEATPLDEALPDPKDVVFYEVTMEGRKSSDAYLVTGNLKQFPEKYFIVSPKEMLQLIEDHEKFTSSVP